MLDFLIILLIFVVVLYFVYLPHIDRTREGKWLLWYGRRNRRYIVLNPD